MNSLGIAESYGSGDGTCSLRTRSQMSGVETGDGTCITALQSSHTIMNSLKIEHFHKRGNTIGQIWGTNTSVLRGRVTIFFEPLLGLRWHV